MSNVTRQSKRISSTVGLWIDLITSHTSSVTENCSHTQTLDTFHRQVCIFTDGRHYSRNIAVTPSTPSSVTVSVTAVVAGCPVTIVKLSPQSKQNRGQFAAWESSLTPRAATLAPSSGQSCKWAWLAKTIQN